jgi:hypothetical protein
MKKSLLILCFLLCACQTPEQLEAAKQQQMQADYNTCVGTYGFKPKSDAARNCMLQIELAREQARTNAVYGDPYVYGPPIGTGFYYLHH